MKIAIIHEWLTTQAGSENVLEQIIALYPQADLFAVVDFLPADQRGFLQGRPVRTTFLQRIPMARRLFRHLLFLMPLAIEQLDLQGYDLVISSSHAVAKGVLTGPDQCHVSYVHSPMRYAWDMQHQYLRQSGLDRGLKGVLARALMHWMRLWDLRTANGIDLFVANSSFIARRVWKVYRRDSVVVAPPADLVRFRIGGRRGQTYLAASRLVPYKRIELVVQAFVAMPDRTLIVAGDGPERDAIDQAAQGAANISIRGRVSQPEMVRLMQQARALIFPAEEDFGITMVEAQACGTPVLAYGRGGARDIVRSDLAGSPTGMFFAEQSAAAITEAVKQFEMVEDCFTPEACRANALRFSASAFRDGFRAAIEAAWTGRHHDDTGVARGSAPAWSA